MVFKAMVRTSSLVSRGSKHGGMTRLDEVFGHIEHAGHRHVQ